ncbi:oxidoreductase [Actinoplanes sp. TBRC 11911]|uniref:ferredoxin reductase n=1 Tax=Actinoplanes sp. TBRC 11911 TaxID=2729386 RepID=UPI00145D5207|nr:ferredoxin reductase [Actinoplanes sp. TBRC 11911]NMO55254.1 oxidoreductase [Actinoplanes sp. TBRC 11911]
MTQAAVSRRLNWRIGTVTGIRAETPSIRTLVLDVPDWPGHLAGQHIDVRLTAPDGYQAQRSYSIGSAWSSPPGTVELTVQRLDDGEVSPYLTDTVEVGDQVELRGPVGGWFVWRETQTPPVLLIGGGSGVVPLMAMIRQRSLAKATQPFRLIYSVRTPEDVCYAQELRDRVRDEAGLDVRFVYTRKAPEGWAEPPKRIDAATLNTYGWPPEFMAETFVCGPTSFVETTADILIALGHDARRIRTERFGGK